MTASDRHLREVGGDDAGEDNAIERAGASDAGDSGLKCLDVAKVEQIGADGQAGRNQAATHVDGDDRFLPDPLKPWPPAG